MNQKTKHINPQDRLDRELWNLLQQIEYERITNPKHTSIVLGIYIVDEKFRLLEILKKQNAFTIREVKKIGGSISLNTGVRTINSITPSNLVLDLKPGFEKVYKKYKRKFSSGENKSLIVSQKISENDEDILLNSIHGVNFGLSPDGCYISFESEVIYVSGKQKPSAPALMLQSLISHGGSLSVQKAFELSNTKQAKERQKREVREKNTVFYQEQVKKRVRQLMRDIKKHPKNSWSKIKKKYDLDFSHPKKDIISFQVLKKFRE